MSPVEKAGESEIRSLLLDYRRQNWAGIQRPNGTGELPTIFCVRMASASPSCRSRLSPPGRSRILGVGSGVGSFVVGWRRRGLRAFRVEPDRIGQGAVLTPMEIARRCVDEQVFAVAVGEKLLFADACFDLVTMNEMMEHVEDQKLVLQEALRVVRPGGVVYIACPNYLWFYKPHYKIFCFPLLPKALGRLHLRLRGRDPVLLDQLTYTTNSHPRRLCGATVHGSARVDLHGQAFLAQYRDASFARRWLRIVAKSMRLPLVGRGLQPTALAVARLTEGGCEVGIVRGAHPVDGSC